VAADDHLEGRRQLCARIRDAYDKAGANAIPEQTVCRLRHRHRSLARRDDAKRSVRQRVRGGHRRLDKATRIDGGNAGAEDGDEILAKSVEGTSQCVCLGSDQAERPVTTSNCFRSELTNCGAFACEERLSSCEMTFVIAVSTSVIAPSE
jgi:hypothetical protein